MYRRYEDMATQENTEDGFKRLEIEVTEHGNLPKYEYLTKRIQTGESRDFASDSDILGFPAFPPDIYLFIIRYTDMWELCQKQPGNEIRKLYYKLFWIIN